VPTIRSASSKDTLFQSTWNTLGGIFRIEEDIYSSGPADRLVDHLGVFVMCRVSGSLERGLSSTGAPIDSTRLVCRPLGQAASVLGDDSPCFWRTFADLLLRGLVAGIDLRCVQNSTSAPCSSPPSINLRPLLQVHRRVCDPHPVKRVR